MQQWNACWHTERLAGIVVPSAARRSHLLVAGNISARECARDRRCNFQQFWLVGRVRLPALSACAEAGLSLAAVLCQPVAASFAFPVCADACSAGVLQVCRGMAWPTPLLQPPPLHPHPVSYSAALRTAWLDGRSILPCLLDSQSWCVGAQPFLIGAFSNFITPMIILGAMDLAAAVMLLCAHSL